jgi:hypothetical protein
MEFAPLNPLAGDLMPAADGSSPSASVVAGFSSGRSGRWRLIAGGFGSALRGEVTLGLLTGGGDRNRGETGHRGASLGSAVEDGFWGVGALMVGSEATGCREGVVTAERTRCWAAADGGLLEEPLGARDGLTS